jgi:hypothetical protein
MSHTDALREAMLFSFAQVGILFIWRMYQSCILRQKTIRIVGEVNAREGYKNIGIYKPVEVNAVSKQWQ